MVDPEEILRDSPVDFDSAVAYALHPEMRRLVVLAVVGAILLPIGLSLFIDPDVQVLVQRVVWQLIGLAVALVGATFLAGGGIGAAFKLVTDANLLAREQ